MAFTSYYDASGTETQPNRPIAVVGVTGRKGRWLSFEREWNQMLRSFDLPYFRMTEFAQSKAGSPFESWKNDEVKRRDCLSAIIDLARKYINKYFVMVIHPEHYAEVGNRFNWSGVSPYPLAAVPCVGQTRTWLAQKHAGHAQLHIIERGDTGQGEIDKVLGALGIDAIVRPACDLQGNYIRPFEVADFIAYEFAKYVDQRLKADPTGRTTVKPRYAIPRLIREIPHETAHHTPETLLEMCTLNPTAFPRRD